MTMPIRKVTGNSLRLISLKQLQSLPGNASVCSPIGFSRTGTLACPSRRSGASRCNN